MFNLTHVYNITLSQFELFIVLINNTVITNAFINNLYYKLKYEPN